MSAPTGIVSMPFDIGPEQAAEVKRRFEEWRSNPSAPLILGKDVKFRQLLPDGTLEPVVEPTLSELSEELIVERDWLPYLIAASGWIAAIVAIVFA